MKFLQVSWASSNNHRSVAGWALCTQAKLDCVSRCEYALGFGAQAEVTVGVGDKGQSVLEMGFY